MIDLDLYRARIGSYNRFGPKKRNNIIHSFLFEPEIRSFKNSEASSMSFIFNTIIYCLLFFLSSSLVIFSYAKKYIFLSIDDDDGWRRRPPLEHGWTLGGLSFLSVEYLKIAYAVLILKAFCKNMNGHHSRLISKLLRTGKSKLIQA